MSNLYEYIKMAVHNIMANKGRSFLTMLGIIIGIASVIAIVSVGEGTKNQMNSEIDDIGGGQIAISVSDEAQTDEEWITADDVEAIRAVDGIEGVNVSDSFSGETTTGKGNFSLMLTGEGPDAKLLNNAKTGDFSSTDIDSVLHVMPNPTRTVIHKGWFPDTFSDVTDETFCFVSLDADLYAPTAAALPLFYERLATGGVLLIHDVYSTQFSGCRKAVGEFCLKNHLFADPVCDLHGSAMIRKL